MKSILMLCSVFVTSIVMILADDVAKIKFEDNWNHIFRDRYVSGSRHVKQILQQMSIHIKDHNISTDRREAIEEAILLKNEMDEQHCTRDQFKRLNRYTSQPVDQKQHEHHQQAYRKIVYYYDEMKSELAIICAPMIETRVLEALGDMIDDERFVEIDYYQDKWLLSSDLDLEIRMCKKLVPELKDIADELDTICQRIVMSNRQTIGATFLRRYYNCVSAGLQLKSIGRRNN